jgi:hypothetical protein
MQQQGYFVGTMYDEADWRRQWACEGWLTWQSPQSPSQALELIPRLTGELTASIVAATQDASIDTVCQAVEAICDELRERVFDQLEKTHEP